MTKDEFVTNVAEKSGLPRPEAEAAVDAFLESITDALRAGDEVKFTGVGSFSTTKGRKGLREAAAELREDAEELGREHKTFRMNLEQSQKTLKDIAGAT